MKVKQKHTVCSDKLAGSVAGKLPGHQCNEAGDEDDAGVDGVGDGVLHHPVRVGWMVKGEENCIGDDAEHPEDDKADHQHKPLQPHLMTTTTQQWRPGKEGKETQIQGTWKDSKTVFALEAFFIYFFILIFY